MLVGEDMPDKNDPKYKERYEKEVAAGRKFAKTTRIDRAAAKVQGFANAHKTLFLVIVFGFVATCFGINIYRMVRYYGHQPEAKSAIERQKGAHETDDGCRPLHHSSSDASGRQGGARQVSNIKIRQR